MDPDGKFNALPKGQEGTLLLVSTIFLGFVFTIIGGFIFKLWYDERQTRRNREAYAELNEDSAGGKFGLRSGELLSMFLGARNRRGGNRVPDFLSSDGNFGEFQPGHEGEEEDRSDVDGGKSDSRGFGVFK